MDLDTLLAQLHRILLGAGPQRPSALRDWPALLAAAREGGGGRASNALAGLEGGVARFAIADAESARSLHRDLAESLEALRLEVASWPAEERRLSGGDGQRNLVRGGLSTAASQSNAVNASFPGSARLAPIGCSGVARSAPPPDRQLDSGNAAVPQPAPPKAAPEPLPPKEPEAEAPDAELLREFHAEAQELLGEAGEQLSTLEGDATALEPVEGLFRCFHTLKGGAGMVGWGSLKYLAHAAEDLLESVRSGGGQLDRARLECLFATLDIASVLVDEALAALEVTPWAYPDDSRVASLIERIRSLEQVSGDEPATQLPKVVRTTQPPSSDEPTAAAVEPPAASASPKTDSGRVRVDARRLDEVCDLIGELAIQQTRVSAALRIGDATAARVGQEQQSKMMRELQALTGSLRMQPLVGTFRKMARLVRNAATTAGKQVRFHVMGGDTELDKSVVDRLAEPLIHLLRNAIDHGLESDPAARVALGKAEVGSVTLRAARHGRTIHVQVEDDGRGLDRDRIVSKARQRGLIAGDAKLTDTEVYRLICEPGFSTREEVTSLSGRGVGMNVVHRQIERMGGRLHIRSAQGVGTCFSLRLPLTLAVVDGLVIRVGEGRYVVPALEVQRLVRVKDTGVATAPDGRQLLKVAQRDGSGPGLVPLIQLEQAFHWPLRQQSRAIAVLLEAEGAPYALAVDELLGRHNGIIRGLGPGLEEAPGISSCAILPDGQVALVLEAVGLLRQAQVATTSVATEVVATVSQCATPCGP